MTVENDLVVWLGLCFFLLVTVSTLLWLTRATCADQSCSSGKTVSLRAAHGREGFVPGLANLPSCKLPAKMFVYQQRRTHGVCVREFGVVKAPFGCTGVVWYLPQGFPVCEDLFWFVSQVEPSVTKAPEPESPSDSSLKIRMETCHACSMEEPPKGPSAEREKEAKEKHLSSEPLCSPSQAEGTEGTFRDASAAGSSCQEFLRLSPDKEVMKEVSRVKREVCLTLLECVCPWSCVDCV